MRPEELPKILQSLNKTELQIILWYVRFRWMRHKVMNILGRVDLWFFPPLAFISGYKAISLIVPAGHPMAFFAIMATSFMCATLTLFLLRPIKRKSVPLIDQD